MIAIHKQKMKGGNRMRKRNAFFSLSTLALILIANGCATTPASCPPGTEADPSQPAGTCVLKRVRVGYNPIGVVVTPDDKFIYVANSIGDSVSKIATDSFNVVSTLQLNGNPAWLAIAEKRGWVCVTARSGRSLNLLDISGNFLVHSIDLQYTPERVVIHPSENVAFISSSAAAYLTMVDLEKQKMLKHISTGRDCSGLGLTLDGKFLYVCTEADRNNLLVVSTEEQIVTTRIKVGSLPVAVAMHPSGQYAYIANQASDDITVIYVPTHHPVLTVPVGKGPVDLAVTPSGNYLYVTCQMDNSLVIIDTATNQVVYRLDLEITPWGITFSRDGSRAYVANYKDKTIVRTRQDIVGPQITLGSGATQRVNNNNLLVLETKKYK